METNDKRARQRASEIKVYVCPPVIRDVALLNNALALQLLVRELVRAEHLVSLLLARLAFGLPALIM